MAAVKPQRCNVKPLNYAIGLKSHIAGTSKVLHTSYLTIGVGPAPEISSHSVSDLSQSTVFESNKSGVSFLLPLSAHSQITSTRHPVERSVTKFAISRSTFDPIFDNQKCVLVFGILNDGHE
jgi:hypothetical protein